MRAGESRQTVRRAVYALLLSSLSAHFAAAAPAVPATDEPDIAHLEQQLAAGKTSAAGLVQHYQGRIARVDQSGPTLHSVIELNPEATGIAARLDATHGPRGPLFGIPVLLKDNIDTADRMHTTAGSLALVDSKPPRDAFIVTRLRAAGAVLLGKTNMNEWANFRSSHSAMGWSGRGGQTYNPYVLDRSPGGSSSGSAVAVAANLTPVAVGTETEGSIVFPSSVTGIVGIKPTLGLVSRSGIIPVSASQDTAGPMARTVTDAAVLLNVLAGYDPDDPATAYLKDHPPPDFTRELSTDSLKGVRIGVIRHFAQQRDEVNTLFEHALAVLRERGAVLVDPVEIASTGKLDLEHQFDDDEEILLTYEFKDGINRYLAARGGAGPRTLQDLIAFNNREAAREMPFFAQELFIASEACGPLSDKRYLDAYERVRRQAGPEGIDAALARDKLDALVGPTMGPASTIDLVDGDHFGIGDLLIPAAVAGYPHVTVPMGAIHDLPVGLSFAGPAWSDARLIGYAYAFEQAGPARRPPAYRATVTP